MIDSPERPKRYNLGWYRRDIATAASYLVYVLVPDWLGAFPGAMEFERISGSGLAIPKVFASTGDLASPRQAGDPEGVPLLGEQRLIRALQVRATRAHNTLPEIVPSIKSRGWAQMPLDEKQLRQLLRGGGLE
jgi:hypothetical protein